MYSRPQLTRLKPMVVILSTAYAAFGVLAASQAFAADTINPAGQTITSAVSFNSSYGPADRYINHGTIQVGGGDFFGISMESSSLGTLSNTGLISQARSDGTGVYLRNSTMSLLDNSGTISSQNNGIHLGTDATITSLLNSGTISGQNNGIYVDNTGNIDTLDNSGTISGQNNGIYVRTSGNIGTLSNRGLIDSGSTAVFADGSISSLSNSGTIRSNDKGIYVSPDGNIGTLSNRGLIDSVSTAVFTDGSISSLDNSGTISSPYTGIYVTDVGTIGTLSNSGLLKGSSGSAVYSVGAIGTIVNTGTIAGDIASDQSLTFAGNNTQGTLTGANGTSVGSIAIIRGDVLFVSGKQLLNDNVLVGLTHTVSNSGAALQVNQPVTIHGKFSQAAGASLLLGVSDSAVATGSVASDSGYGRLVVNGTANIAAGSSVGLVRSGSSYNFASGQRYVVVTASSSGTNYHENALNYSATGYRGAVSGSAIVSGNRSSLVLSLASGGTKTEPLPTTHNAVASLGGLSNYGGVASGLLDLYNASLAIGTTAEANRVGEQLAPTQSTNAGSAASGATLDVLSVVGQHSDSVRLADAGGSSGISAGDSYADWQAWGQLFAGKASQGTTDGISGYNANYNGVVAGADRLFGDKWRAGAAFSYSGTWVKGADSVSGNTSRVYSWGLISYASYYGNPWYLNLSGSINRQNYHSNRLVSLSGYADTATADFNGDQYVLKSEFGYPLAGPWGSTVTPLTALSYSYQNQDGYTETSANGSALKVGSAHAEAIRGSLGGKVDKSWSTRYGELTPAVQLLWTHQFNKSRMTVTSNYLADPTGDTSFTSQGASPVQDTADLSLGLTLQRRNNLSLTARYDRQDGAHYRAQTLSLRLRKQF